MSTNESGVPASKPRTWGLYIAVLFMCVCLLSVSSCVYTAFTRARAAARKGECKNKLKMIGIALHSYHDRFGVFPPAVTRDSDGNAVHSWRALILPFLEERASLAQVSSYDQNFAWDSEENRPATDVMPGEGAGYGSFFRCWKDTAVDVSHTSVLAITGAGTIWSENEATRRSDISRTEETVIAIECAETGIPWAEPRDLAMDADFTTLQTRHGESGGVYALMANGAVRYFPNTRFMSPDFRPYFLKEMPPETPPLD